jgi:hypothetical protein
VQLSYISLDGVQSYPCFPHLLHDLGDNHIRNLHTMLFGIIHSIKIEAENTMGISYVTITYVQYFESKECLGQSLCATLQS